MDGVRQAESLRAAGIGWFRRLARILAVGECVCFVRTSPSVIATTKMSQMTAKAYTSRSSNATYR